MTTLPNLMFMAPIFLILSFNWLKLPSEQCSSKMETEAVLTCPFHDIGGNQTFIFTVLYSGILNV